ncbi:MAG: hypothetical protein QOF02_3134 [Blastocatellia bacterium]|jgi:hypothetical protein|nr:hypothetical protein [Blastocatellia bacterium]
MYKRRRLGPVILDAARRHAHYKAAHAFIGGTGAVGGAALLQMLSVYGEMFAIEAPEPDDVPVLLATGHREDDIRAFTRRLFRAFESIHGPENKPTPIRSGYITHYGAFVALERFNVAFLAELQRALNLADEERPEAVRGALEALRLKLNLPNESSVQVLAAALNSARPLSQFLKNYADKFLPASSGKPYRSVVIGIPIPTLIAYHHGALDLVSKYVNDAPAAELESLKHCFGQALRDDLVHVQNSLADNLIVAHTTGVGGMYDEVHSDEGPKKTIRLGFAHAAQDEALLHKHRFAEELTQMYAEAGIKTLVTAAAIGIDEVRIRERIPLHFQVAKMLFDFPRELFPGSKKTLPADAKASRKAGHAAPARQFVNIHQPVTVHLTHPNHRPAQFDRGAELRPGYALRSGENGFFSVANAEALYRTMRVASASELGHVLASVGLFGDDPDVPWFPGGVCYYAETDNSRQIFDFLRQPALMQMQLSGLEPMALQDLGSSKHQGELHTLALLILLHRLRTLDLDSLDPYVDPAHFDAARFFVERSRPLTFEDIESWNFTTIAEDLATLVAADNSDDLMALRSPIHRGLFPNRDKAIQMVFKAALSAVWMIPSLGSPLIFNRGRESFMKSGYFVAPLNLLLSDTDTVDRWFHETHNKSENPCSHEEFRDFHICDRGFIDLRPHAMISTARNSDEDLTGKIMRAESEEELRLALSRIPPYSYFTTCGLLAVIYRLRGLYRLLREGMIELGTFHEFRWQMTRDDNGHILVVPGAVEAFRMVSEGLDKTTGTERLDGIWGYERRPTTDRRGTIPGLWNIRS